MWQREEYMQGWGSMVNQRASNSGVFSTWNVACPKQDVLLSRKYTPISKTGYQERNVKYH